MEDFELTQDPSVRAHHRGPRISVIIPTLNEKELVKQAIESARRAERVEVLVVDGGSQDGTPEVAGAAGARVISSPAGRASQMNAGAATARGSILLFLHADTRLPGGYADELEKLLSRPGTALAAFRLGIDHPRVAFRWIERFANLRSRWLGLPYGDQGLAVRADDFYRLGGFHDLPIMEDFEFVSRARRMGRVVTTRSAVRTSPRRWLNTGVLRLTLIHQACIIAYRVGVSPKRIAAWRGNDMNERSSRAHNSTDAEVTKLSRTGMTDARQQRQPNELSRPMPRGVVHAKTPVERRRH